MIKQKINWCLMSPGKVFHKFIVQNIRKLMLGSCGKDVTIGKQCDITWENVYAGNDVHIGSGCRFLSTRAAIRIGDHVMFGPNVTIITGDHRIDILDKPMTQVTDREKRPEDDQDVIFEGDNWIGANVTILKGVKIGRGSVIAAGAVVTKNVTDYSIWGGVPAKKIHDRFEPNELKTYIFDGKGKK